MRVLFLTSGDRVPSTRFRVLPFLDYLPRAGLRTTLASSFPQKYDYFPWLGFRPSQLLKRAVRWYHWLAARLRRYDVVFLERELFDDPTTRMEERFRQVAARLVLDLDDAVFLRYPEKIERLVRLSDLVIAGNPWIADRLRDWNPAIVVIPTGVELARFPPRPDPPSGVRPVIGWIGTTGNLPYLEVAAGALRSLARRRDFELRLVVPPMNLPAQVDLRGVDVQQVPWSPASEVAEIQRFDVGLMPLFGDREWDKYKCPTKLIQYMAAGLAAVASPVGFTGDVLTPGVDGFYATTPRDWEEHLDRLLEDPSLRQRIGAAARATVAARYCVEANWPLLARALRGEDGPAWPLVSSSPDADDVSRQPSRPPR